MLPIRKNIIKFNFKDDDTTDDIEYIVIHDTGNKKDSDEGNAKYFSEDKRGASAHYFVDDDSITQVVEDEDIAWHVGDGKGAFGITNKNSLGIEMCRVNSTVTTTTEANTIELVKSLMKKYNVPIERVVRHYDASRKPCPVSFQDNNWDRWNKFKRKLVEPVQTSKNLFRVQVGAFGEEVNAKAMLEKLKQAGFDGIITRA